jgi:SAM-dependent methyltransferase
VTPGTAYALALSGADCSVVDDDGRSRPLPARRWLEAASTSDRRLFVIPCSGPTLDIGCGPGRLLVALQEHGVQAHGIDLSREAVARACAGGGSASRADVFSPLPGEGAWSHALLADGNVGIGGQPSRLLARVRRLLAPGGHAHVELDADAGPGVSTLRLRLQVGGRHSKPFQWATVGAGAIGRLADGAGLRLLRLDRHSGRVVARLRKVG